MSAAEPLELQHTVAERRAWKDGFNAGEKAGALRFFQSGLMEQLAVEHATLRKLVMALGKRDVWYREKLRDAYHVILNPRPPR